MKACIYIVIDPQANHNGTRSFRSLPEEVRLFQDLYRWMRGNQQGGEWEEYQISDTPVGETRSFKELMVELATCLTA